MKFKLGQIYITRGAMDELRSEDIAVSISRHALGDWGVLCDFDKTQNDLALRDGSRLLSAYESNGTRFWIITERDRSSTTVLLPSEY
jgi:hypothetical protein